MLRETGDCDVKVVAIFFMDVPDEIDAVDEAPFDCFPFFFALRWVTSKGEDVTASVLFGFL